MEYIITHSCAFGRWGFLETPCEKLVKIVHAADGGSGLHGETRTLEIGSRTWSACLKLASKTLVGSCVDCLAPSETPCSPSERERCRGPIGSRAHLEVAGDSGDIECRKALVPCDALGTVQGPPVQHGSARDTLKSGGDAGL